MDQKVTCQKCGMAFEASHFSQTPAIQCPGCFSPVSPAQKMDDIEVCGYKLLKLLGQGGMGQVYLAESPDKHLVAFKIMSQEYNESIELLERFKREMSIMASLDHPNIVKILFQGVEKNIRFFAMELVEGETLRSVIRQKLLSLNTIVSTTKAVLGALNYAHAKGIVHRDIKPENILFDKTGNVKVTDFGLARKSSFNSSDNRSLTAVNAFLGTESYMSPEQKINPKEVTHKSDLYSFGVVLYEMLTDGVLPMGLFQPPSCHKQLDEFWDSLVFRMLDINPDLRPTNCQEVIAEIEKFEIAKKTGQEMTFLSPEPVNPDVVLINEPIKDEIALENERISTEIKRICDQAYEHFQAGQFNEALPLWERALIAGVAREDEENIRQWITVCTEKINSITKVTLLCTGSKKTFQKSPKEIEAESFHCPICNKRLRFDKGKKLLVMYEPEKTVVHFKDPESTPNKTPEKKESFIPLIVHLNNLILLLLVVSAIVDYSQPELLLGWCQNIQKTAVPGTFDYLPENIRLGIRVGIIVFSLKPAYDFYTAFNS